MITVLALDPAESTGYALARVDGKHADIYEYGLISVEPHEYEGDRCIDLMNQVRALIEKHNVTRVAIEDYFFSRRFATGCDMNMAYRTAIHILCRQMSIDYTIVNVSSWKKFVAGRTTPTKLQKDRWGKAPAKKLMIQEALWERFDFRFPNHSISAKTGKPIKFKYDVVDAVAQMVYFCHTYLHVNDVELSVPVPDDVELKNVRGTFQYR